MKIAFFINKFPSLSETFILNQITGLIDLGHNVDIYARGKGSKDIIHASVEKYRLLDRTRYIHFPKNRWLRIIKAIGLIFTNFYKTPKTILNSMNFFKHGDKAFSLILLYIAAHFNKTYDIVHCHFGPTGNLGILIKDIGRPDTRIITTFHGFDITSYTKSRGSNIYKALFSKGDLFLPISNRWKQKLIELGCPKEKIIVHKMGIDTHRFPFAPDKIRNNSSVRILTVARLVEKKGVKYGIQAVSEALKSFPEITYYIAGDGPLKNELLDLINSLNISDKVKLLGWKEQGEIAELMTQADILLAPSITSDNGDQEGIPVVLMEAMARGLPVISTFHSGIPELIIDGKTGLMVNERDTKALSQKIKQLITHPELHAMLRRDGRKFVEENHDINRLNSALEVVFKRLLSSKAKS